MTKLERINPQYLESIASTWITSQLLSSTLQLWQSSVFKISARKVAKLYNKLETFRLIDIIVYNYIQAKLRDRIWNFRFELQSSIRINWQTFSEVEVEILDLNYQQVWLATSVNENRKWISKGKEVIAGNAQYIWWKTLFEYYKDWQINREQSDLILNQIVKIIEEKSWLNFNHKWVRFPKWPSDKVIHPINIKVITDWRLRLIITDISEDVVNFATNNFESMIGYEDFWILLDYLFNTIDPYFDTDYKIADYFMFVMFEFMWYETFKQNVINWKFRITKITFNSIFAYLGETETINLIWEWKLPLSEDVVKYLHNYFEKKYWFPLKKWWYIKK